jgi:dephospho-CoA kinase
MNLRPLVVTGPIGSGKSTASKLFESFGADRFDLDLLGRDVLETREGIDFVRGRWPEAINDDTVDRSGLARIVFADHEELRALEGFVHPRVLALLAARSTDPRARVVEVSVPKLVVPNGYVLVIDTPKELRVQRLLLRGMAPADVEARIAAQPGRQEWLARADAVVANRLGEHDLMQAAKAFWEWWSRL